MSLSKLKRDKRSLIDKEIDSVLELLGTLTPGTEEYKAVRADVEGLYRAKGEVKPEEKVSPNTIAQIVANLIGIVVVLEHEKLNVITSKAFNMIAKLRV